VKKRLFWYVMALFTCLLVISVSLHFNPQVIAQTPGQYTAELAFPNLTFNQPDGILADPANSNRIFVTEQTGTIRVFNDTSSTNFSTVFLDITDLVLFGGEQGLLGLAFHPNFNQNGYFYINYVADNPRRTVIARYTVNANETNSVDKNSEQIILEIPQPYSNHKGGQLAFGSDGYLYIGVGDGGSEGDPQGNGQNRSSLLGENSPNRCKLTIRRAQLWHTSR
jgi:glucose/arabinose dehydrogenase